MAAKLTLKQTNRLNGSVAMHSATDRNINKVLQADVWSWVSSSAKNRNEINFKKIQKMSQSEAEKKKMEKL